MSKQNQHQNLPTHIAVIPDGNRRWAKERFLNPQFGHTAGVKRFEEITEAVFKRDIPYFTFWAASVDNLVKRSKIEVRHLVNLMREQLKSRIESAEKDQIRFRIIGRGKHIVNDTRLFELISEIERKTAIYQKHNATILFGYDGFEEMKAAVNKIVDANPDSEVNCDAIKNALWTKDLPAVDLVIRTGGVRHNLAHNSSGFMMWDTGNSIYYYPCVLWPDFSEIELERALGEYTLEPMRFGT